jgi:hypothetical protein
MPLIVAVGALRERSWAKRAHALVGATLMGWIVLQIIVVASSQLQAIQIVFCLVGFLVFVLGSSLRESAAPARPAAT